MVGQFINIGMAGQGVGERCGDPFTGVPAACREVESSHLKFSSSFLPACIRSLLIVFIFTVSRCDFLIAPCEKHFSDFQNAPNVQQTEKFFLDNVIHQRTKPSAV